MVNNRRHVLRQRLVPPQTPKLGRYDSTDPNVVRDHIAQSVRGGIAFWASSWWRPGDYTDTTLHDVIFKHPDAGKLKYAILYESTGRLGTFARPDYSRWIDDLNYLQKTYFDHPYYLRIDGRPVLFVYLTREYFRNKGHEALREMREKFPNLYLVGDDVFGAGYKAEWARNFDAVTAYDVYGQSVGPFGGTHAAIELLARNYAGAKAAANSVGVAFMPTIAPGYNDTAVRRGHPGRARYFSDVESSHEGDVFRAMITDVAVPNLDPKCGRIMMVTSFNEWYEDTQIEATAGTQPKTTTDDSDSGTALSSGQQYADYGYLYLDILREALP
jgi:glycoprotein endo-alpha-1,2-mannosidase